MDRRGEIRIHSEMRALTLGVIAEALFGHDAEEVVAPTNALVEGNNDHLVDVWLSGLDGRSDPRQAAQDSLDSVIYRLIERRRSARTRSKDVADALLDAEDGQGNPLTDLALRDEIVTLLVAGHETTASALTFALYLLGRHGMYCERLHARESGSVMLTCSLSMGSGGLGFRPRRRLPAVRSLASRSSRRAS